MQHPRFPHPSSRTSTSISTFFCLLLFVTDALAISIPKLHPPAPAYSIQPRQEFNETAFFIANCGLNFVRCDGACCRQGEECLVSTQTNKTFCGGPRSNPTSSPTAPPPPSSPPSNGPPVGAIVGSTLGTVGLFAIIGAIYWFRRRARRPSAPAIPQAPVIDHSSIVEARYAPASEPSYSGDKWPPGSFLYHHRNRSVSTAASASGGVASKQQDAPEPLNVAELPTTAPTAELPGDDGYFAIHQHPPVPPPPPILSGQLSPPTSPMETTPMAPGASGTPVSGSQSNTMQFWGRS
ncbi:hypothetical protein DRE_03705 [Drechslerella stenobrocha 248]|uniref:Uncharacterized protein n=1 Tax=Drechslerella stenobrocha 248 TaxID=1043628 RepID=W7I3Z7_9PEZI|nr:hypothetical protein DRE_03705 [Drechslerella stenobrocha 248]